ncbi:MAG: DUF2309 domain-containing protein [Pirellula sp.]|nr:DUF2309 domain-containing protein [Pirellula sp.]
MNATMVSYATRKAKILAAIEHAAHYLPSQGPIQVFVHHNTLHAFESEKFEDAVLLGKEHFGGEPYWSEARYHRELEFGRISRDDLEVELQRHTVAEGNKEILSGLSRNRLRMAMLSAPIKDVSKSQLDWLVTETLGELPRFLFEQSEQTLDTEWYACRENPIKARKLLRDLYEACRENTEKWPNSIHSLNDDSLSRYTRPNKLVSHLYGLDLDGLVNELLIRFCAAYLDQGFAGLQLPARETGLWSSFIELYSAPFSLLPDWAKSLKVELQRVRRDSLNAIDVLEESLQFFEVPDEKIEDFLGQSAMVLPGWSGVISQLEEPNTAVSITVPRGTLVEFISIRVLLDRLAIAHAYKVHNLEIPHQALGEELRREVQQQSATERDVGFLVFQVVKRIGMLPDRVRSMNASDWRNLVEEIVSFDSMARRQLLHCAYERNYRVAILNALRVHQQHRSRESRETMTPPVYQTVFCIDDREESIRRHLEEVEPNAETYGAAGFFAVAMNYRGVAEAHYRPQCPVNVKPIHFVREEPVFSAVADDEKRSRRRKRVGQFSLIAHAGSRSLLGGAITSILGSFATFPLVARILAPRITAKLRKRMGSIVQPPSTELHLERQSGAPGMSFESLGYSHGEMANIVIRLLQDIGLISGFSKLIAIVGHGSSSLNNPHESAYNCGACCGGRGGANARAFAWMANHPTVRRLVSERGLEIPDDVYFIGAYHNTCNDHIQYYDLDRVPASHRSLFRKLESDLNEARRRNAHERCRRFESAPFEISLTEALNHVEQRSEDLSQVRPEYNHATNALCLVGSRKWSRGLFLDRRSFLVSYEPSKDDQRGSILERILQAVIPVCGGINLEYYFSTVDPEVYGCGSKLPHNITSLVGVMSGATSDLRPGLSAQMVEIHEPMRLLFVVQSDPQTLRRIIDSNSAIQLLVENRWVQLATFEPKSNQILIYENRQFLVWDEALKPIPIVKRSQDWYQRKRDSLTSVTISGGVQ